MVFLSFLIRLLLILLFPNIDAPDTESYVIPAWNLVIGKGYSDNLGNPYAGREIGYPLFLGCVFLSFGKNLFAVKLFQVLIGSLTCIIIYLIARTLFSEKIAFYSGLVSAIYPDLVAPTCFVLTEVWYIFLLSLSVFFLVKAVKTEKKILFAISGFFFGLCCLTRTISLPFPIFLFLGMFAVFSNKKKAALNWTIFSLVVCLLLSPWVIRNFIIFNEFIPGKQSSDEHPFWIGTYIPWEGNYLAYKEPFPYKDRIKGLSQKEKNKMLTLEALQHIKENPLGVAWIWLKKIPKLWLGVPGSIKVLENYPLVVIALKAIWIIVLLLGLFGFIKSKDKLKETMPLWILFIYLTITLMPIVCIPRYRIPIEPYVIIFTVVGFCEIGRFFAKKVEYQRNP